MIEKKPEKEKLFKPLQEERVEDHLTLEKFINVGFLQQINRIVMHPLGLTLAASILPDEIEKGRVSSDRIEFMCSVVISRDIGGCVYTEREKNEVLEKKNNIENLKDLLRKRRIETHGFEIQWGDE